jgi:metallophosphoesterase (TIGR00282 family)
MRILFLGDIVGRPGRDIVCHILPTFRAKNGIDFVIANGENAAGGSGMTPRLAEELLEAGVDVLTSGDHIWKKKEIYDYLNSTDRLIRPANYPAGVPGKGATAVRAANGAYIGVVNLVGRVFMEAVECPFQRGKEEAEKLAPKTRIIILDMHAEATSEKVAMGWFLDGMVSAIIGTHTHIQTADEKILPRGTAYITDCGMTGPYDSVIGRRKAEILERFITQLPVRFEMATDDVQMHGVMIDIDEGTGKATAIKRVQEKA